MKARILVMARMLLFILGIFLLPSFSSFSGGMKPEAQEFPAKTPKDDYLSRVLSRNTKPLGLKEDLELKNLLRQPGVKWAIRAGSRYILE